MTEPSQAGGERAALIHALDRYLRQDETAGDTDNNVYRDGLKAMSAALSAPPADPFREHLATQAENINTERLDKALVLMGVARAGEGQEAFAARLAENVNRLTRAITMHFAAPAAAVAQPVAEDDPYYNLLGVIADAKAGNFNSVCIETLECVAAALASSPSSERQDVGGGRR